MAEIASSTVFTNDIVSYNTPDLLQQAFREVVEHEDHDNEFVTFLAGDDDESQAIHLTHAQASALRLTFQVDSAIQHEGEEIVYQQDPNDMLIEVEENDNSVNKTIELPQTIEQMDLVSDIQWTIDDMEETRVKTLDMTSTNDQVVEEITDEIENHTQSNDLNSILSQHSQINGKNHSNVNTTSNFNEITETTPTYNVCSGSNSQNQTLINRLPVIFPSQQFILKPTQTLLKPAKNIRLIPSSNTMSSSNTNTISSINSVCNNSTQKSVLLSKAAIINSVTPQILKTAPINPQLIHGNAISTQLLDSSRIITCNEITNQNLSNCNGNGFSSNGVTRSISNLCNNSTRVSPLITTTSSVTIQRDNVKQSSTSSISKSNCESTPAVKSHISNGTTTNSITGSFLKTIQIPTQILKTSGAVAKTSNSSTSTKVSVTPTSSMVLKTAPRLKTQQFKRLSTATNATIRQRVPVQSMSTPISILKPQTKMSFTNTSKPNSIINSANISNVNNHFITSGAKLLSKVTRNDQTVHNHVKSVSTNDIKQRSSELSSRIVKKPNAISPSPNPSIIAQNDAGKPLGSSENPIQIVQQGHTFHSMQKLTQSQLKQIAHVLQQRSQESADPNERVVYRVVFPEELDLRMRNPINLLKGRTGKRGRPKKKPSTATKSSTPEEDGTEDVKDERKKPVARTRSGRLSRPPRHIVRDYKHLHHLDLLQPDLDDSDGGYSDYNVNTDKLESEDVAKDLLTGYEGPKRKISDHFRCPTCNKIYLGRTRMAKHFEIHPDHGSADQLPPRTAEQDLKSNSFPPDPFKRKGKKRGPWAYITPEAKSERRQIKLKDALSACDNGEIIKIAAKPLLNAQSLFDLMVLKSDNSLKIFLNELQTLMNKTREQINTMLTPLNDEEKYENTVKLDDKLLCDVLGLTPGLYYIKNDTLSNSTDFYNTPMTTTSLTSSTSLSFVDGMSMEEPPMKVLKVNDEDGKENIDERLSSESTGIPEISDLNIRTNFLAERDLDTINSNCPEVLSALTLIPRSTGSSISEVCRPNNISKLLISNTEIQSQISDNPGFQKIEINSCKNASFKKETEINHNSDMSNCSSPMFSKLNDNYEQSKLQPVSQTFIKLEPMQQGFVKVKNGNVGTYKGDSEIFRKPHNNFENMNETTQTFSNGFQKLISKIVPMSNGNSDCVKSETFTNSIKNELKLSDDVPIIQNNVPIMSTTCDANLFENTDNLDISKITNYDLDILSNSGVIDKHLIMDEKLVEQLHLVDQSNLVDELVSERLKNIMPDNILDSNLMTNNANLDTELDFEALSEEFNRNTRS